MENDGSINIGAHLTDMIYRASAREFVQAWNHAIPIGTVVQYWERSSPKEGDPAGTAKTSSAAFVSTTSDSPLVKLEGIGLLQLSQLRAPSKDYDAFVIWMFEQVRQAIVGDL